jgi:hypothetical protein
MNSFRTSALPLLACAAFVLSTPAGAQTAAKSPVATTTTLGNPITVPGVYESTVSSIGALATSATAALKDNRSEQRTLAIRRALATALMNGGLNEPIDLGKDSALGEAAILCAPRENYVTNSIYLNYLNTLAQNIDTVSAKPPAPTDIPSAIKLLFASSSYTITNKVAVDAAAIKKLSDKVSENCAADLSGYESAYYGRAITTAAAPEAVTDTGSGSGTSVSTFAFLGPIGGAIDTFLSILQPVLINASQAVDEARRLKAIQTALDDPQTQAKIRKAGGQLAAAVDAYSAMSRYGTVGAFVEQLVAIRETKIDLSKIDDCQSISLAAQDRLPSKAPNEHFIGCYNVAWAKIKPQVDNLNTIAGNYDTLADNNTVSASARFDAIMTDFAKLKNEAPTESFLTDITEFISFANAVATAASKSNVAALKSAITAAEK